MIDVDQLVKQSSHALCGTAEREIIVKSELASTAISKLKARGFTFVGRGPAGQGRTKIWFVAKGLELL